MRNGTRVNWFKSSFRKIEGMNSSVLCAGDDFPIANCNGSHFRVEGNALKLLPGTAFPDTNRGVVAGADYGEIVGGKSSGPNEAGVTRFPEWRTVILMQFIQCDGFATTIKNRIVPPLPFWSE